MKKKKAVIEARRSLVLTEECLFLALFLLWTYLAGFRPEAYGTEKFMDYGFMATMMRGDYMPAEDLWYAGEQLNYYYGGQYYAVCFFLTRLTFTRIQETYHLRCGRWWLRLPLSFLFLWCGRCWRTGGRRKRGLAAAGGVLAGTAVSLAGNMHYVLFGKLIPWIRRFSRFLLHGKEYWFPIRPGISATIGGGQ